MNKRGLTPAPTSASLRMRLRRYAEVGAGFTLIELMVSVAIFTIVMVVSLGALLSISSAERKAETIKAVMNNLNFGLESMARTIRTGTIYHCGTATPLASPRDCTTGDDYFAFKAFSGEEIVYQYETNASTCGQTGTGGCITRSIDGGDELPITAPEVIVNNLTFYVIGSPAEFEGDPLHSQPKVVMTVTGEVPLGASQTDFSLQTSVTQRLYDQ